MNAGTAGDSFSEVKFPELIGRSPPMVELKRILAQVAPTDATVLILGETGTGKELIARAIHRASNRSDGHFRSLNCSEFNASVLESELFGYEKGAFTGADQPRQGLFEASNGGTVFLDEVGTAPRETQVKLLRVLQERVIRRVGATNDTSIDVRIISATNENLFDAIENGRFRSDLYYRLKVVDIVTTPLRDRGEDVVLLAEHFLAKWVNEYRKPFSGFSAVSLQYIRQYSWPGNARELCNIIEKAVILSPSVPDAALIELAPNDFLDSPPEMRSMRAGAGTISDLVFANLVHGHIPLLGFERGANELGPIAREVIHAVSRGFEEFLQTGQGRRKLQNFSDSHLIQLLGLAGRKSGNEALFKKSLRSTLLEIVARERGETSR